VTSWIDDRAIVELFHRKSRVVPVPSCEWGSSAGEEGDHRIQYTLIPALLRHQSLVRVVKTREEDIRRTCFKNQYIEQRIFCQSVRQSITSSSA